MAFQPLRDLCVLCVSAVNASLHTLNIYGNASTTTKMRK